MATASASDDKDYLQPISDRAWETMSEMMNEMNSGSDLDASIWCNLDDYILDDKDYLEPIPEVARESMGEMKLGSDLDASIWGNLDDDILEKIFARLVFKSFYQAASLSKGWRLRVHSPAFQSEAQNSSSSWKSYAPVCVSVEKTLLGYESSSKCWHRLPTLNFLQAGHDHHYVDCWLRACHGSLMCWTLSNPNSFHGEEILITNPLTKTWKLIPTRPNMRVPKLLHIVCEGSSAYKLTLGTRRRCWIDVHIYDSITESWTEESYNTGVYKFKLSGWAYMNGVFYMLVRSLEGRPMYNVISLDVEKKVWSRVDLDVKQKVLVEEERPSFFHVGLFDIIICGSNVMLVVHHRDEEGSMEYYYIGREVEDIYKYPRNTLSVFRLDLECGMAWEESRAPNEMFNETGFYSASGEDDCIYFVCEGSPYHSIVYNVGSEEWHWVPGATEIFNPLFDVRKIHSSISYEPGLNPFFKV